MRNLLFGHLEDCSTAQYFCFSVRCEVCGEYWYSNSIPFSKAAQAAQHREKKELYDAIYQREKERAKLEMDLCRECAARMKEPGEPVAP